MDASSRRKRAAAEAAEWWLRIEEGNLSREQRAQLVDWLRESATHVAEMLHLARIHGALEEFRGWEGISTEAIETDENVVSFAQHIREGELDRGSRARGGEASIRENGERTVRRRWLLGGAVAAAMAACAAWWVVTLGMQVIETARGERRGVTLTDGSVIQVDPETRVRVRFAKHTRHVSLERGRALFRVAKDAERPFVVQADGALVRAVGTQFGVERAREGIVVTVAEGKVRVLAGDAGGLPFDGVTDEARTSTAGPGNGPVAAAASAALSRDASARRDVGELLLGAGQQVIVPPRGPTAPVRRVDSGRELAWADGRLVFENQSVSEVMDEFNRYNFLQLHVADAQLANRAVTGVFDASQPESFIGFIQSVAPVRVDRKGQDITISSAP